MTAQLGTKDVRVCDLVDVGMFGFEVTEEAFDPRLVGRGAGPAEMLGDGAQRHELPGRPGGHLRPIVGDGEQDRASRVVEGRVD